jgi:spore germination protein YaaH
LRFVRRRSAAAPSLLAVLLLATSVIPVVAAPPLPTDAALTRPVLAPAAEPDTAGLQPGIHWEEAQAHANDKLDLPAGDRVTVPFQPRGDDRWTVDGRAPQVLPEGRLSGRQLRDAAAGSEPTTTPQPTATPQPATPEPSPSAAADPSPAPTQSPEPTATPAPTDTPIDAPIVDPEDAVPAEPAAYQAAAETAGVTVDPAAVVSPAGLRREIFGFLPYWELTDSSTTLDYKKISTIAYFGVGAAANGSLERTNKDGSTTVGWSGWTSSKMTSVINTAHQNHTRVVLTVQSFAWSGGQSTKQKALLGSATARANLARQIAAAVRDRGADGVNLDFEPLAAGYADEFVLLVKRVRTELNAVAKGYQLTFDTLGYIGNYPIEAATAAGAADAIVIMGYDYRSTGSSPVGSIAPIGGPAYDIADTIKAYAARVPASKLILGIPYYGRAWSTDGSGLNAGNISGTKNGASTAVIYETGIGVLQEHGRKYDTREGVAWTAYRRENCTTTYGCVTPWRQLYMDDATAIRAKYDLVNRYSLRGAGIWALGYDGARPELWAAIKSKFITDSEPPSVAITRLSAGQTSPAFTVKWSGTDDSGIARYDVQVSIDGGSWTGWLTGTTATSVLYAGVEGKRYAFRVRATDVKGNTSAWPGVTRSAPGASLAVGGFGIVRIDGLSARTAPTTAAERIGTVSTGNLLAITDGPVQADGYTWYQIKGALKGWPASVVTFPSAWVATGSATETFVEPAWGPHQTRPAGKITGLGFGDKDLASIGTTTVAESSRSFSPNGDGRWDTLRLRWTNAVAFDTLLLRVYRADGTGVGSVAVPRLAAGAKVWDWDGKVAGTRVKNGTYYVTLVGTVAGATHANPSPGFGGSALVARYGVTVATVLMPFGDVDTFAGSIEWLYMEGITGGCTATRFCPDATVTRAQMAMFLVRAMDLPVTSTDYYDDDDGKTGESSVNALARAGITGGCGPRRFCPTRSITRAQIAQFLVRALDLPVTTTDYFDDDDGKTGESSINALAKAGLTAGCGPRRYCPSASVTREQMAALLFRSFAE